MADAKDSSVLDALERFGLAALGAVAMTAERADALADEVVLVALEFLLQPDTFTLVCIFCLVRPLQVGGCEVVEVEDGGEGDQAAV